jgi:hypothetical protein
VGLTFVITSGSDFMAWRIPATSARNASNARSAAIV